MPGRSFSASEYRYGFQKQEKDNEIYGDGNGISFKYRFNDTRLGRFWSVDPLADDFPWNSPYAFSENRVNDGIELEGLEFFPLIGATEILMMENAPKPIIEVVTESTIKTPTSRPVAPAPRTSPRIIENFKRGVQTEKQQLARNGLDKNTKPIDVEVKPGSSTRTIPDAMKNGGNKL